MAKVEILSYSKSLDGMSLATVELVDGTVVISTDNESLRTSLKRGIMGRRGVVYTPDNGDDFIRELPHVYTGSMMRARLL